MGGRDRGVQKLGGWLAWSMQQKEILSQARWKMKTQVALVKLLLSLGLTSLLKELDEALPGVLGAGGWGPGSAGKSGHEVELCQVQ